MAQIKLAEYTFNNSVGDCLPTLTPNTITMTKEDSVNGTTTKRIIYIDNATLPTRIRFGTDEKSDGSLLTVDYLDIDTNITSMEKMFSGCTKLTYVNTTNWNTTNVTNMYYAFCGTSISEINVTSFNTDKVTNMDYMFGNCSLLKFIDITNFTTRSNMTTGSMFANNKIKVIYDGNKWKSFMSMSITSEKVTPPEHIIAKYKYDTSITSSVAKPTITGISESLITIKEVATGVDSINYVIMGYNGTEQPITNISFRDKKNLLTLDYLNFTNAIKNASRMFAGCTALTSINALNWDTSNVTSMSAMFNSCTSLASLDMSKWDVDNVTNMSDMLYACKLLTTLDLSSWKVDKVTNMSTMFSTCNGLTTLNVSGWDTSSLKNMSRTFNGCAKLTTLDLSHFKVDGVTDMSGMFNGCSALTSLNISTWNTSAVSNMGAMFQGCAKLTTLDLSHFNVDSVTSMNSMFNGCGKLTTLDLSHFKVDSVTNMSNMFDGCTALTSINTSNWDTSNVTNMNYMFRGCSSLITLDLSNWKVDNVTSMSTMFNACSKLTTLNLSNWNTSKVSNMNYMFGGCGKLTTLDLLHFKVDSVTNMSNMFYGCSALTTLDTSNWNTSKVNNMSSMFHNCGSLTTLDLSSWKVDNVTSMSTMFNSCSSLTSLNLSNWNTSKVSNMSYMFGGCGSLTMIDISNFDTSKVTAWGGVFSANKLTNIGLVYASSSTINSIVTNWLGTSVARNIYYMDAEPSELTTQTNITYLPYSQSVLSCSEEIILRSNGDVYDELDLLTGQVIQRIGEDNEILEEEIIRTVELNGEIGFYENSYIHTSSNEITPEFEFQPTLTNCYVVSDLKPNTQYTVLFEGNPTLMSLGGTTIENPTSKMMITSGEVDNILWFNTSVSKIMILEGDLTNRDVEYFTGVKSSQKIEVQLRGNTPYFAKGGRK